LLCGLLLPAVGFGSEGDGFEDVAGEVLVVVVEAVKGFEEEGEAVGGSAFVRVEDEQVSADREGDGDVAEDIEGGGGGAGLVTADLADVDADVFGEGILGEVPFLAESSESLCEGRD